jgi:hypothetical protein
VLLSSTAELLEGHIDATVAYRVRWGTRSALVVALLHFPELEAKLELLGSRHNVDLTEDQVDTLWTQTRLASDSLTSYVLPSAARSSPDGAG